MAAGGAIHTPHTTACCSVECNVRRALRSVFWRAEMAVYDASPGQSFGFRVLAISWNLKIENDSERYLFGEDLSGRQIMKGKGANYVTYPTRKGRTVRGQYYIDDVFMSFSYFFNSWDTFLTRCKHSEYVREDLASNLPPTLLEERLRVSCSGSNISVARCL